MEDESEEEFDKIGEIGSTSKIMDEQVMFWRIVVNLHFTPSEVDKWTLEEMRIVSAFLKMQNDYKDAYSVLMDMERGE